MQFYRLPGRDEEDGHENPLRVGDGFWWSVAWERSLISYVGLLYEEPPFLEGPDDVERDPEDPVLWYGVSPLEIQTVDELQGEMDVELPADIVEQLEADKERHLTGQAGEPVDEIMKRIREYAEGAGPRWHE